MVCGYLPFEDPNTGDLYKKILACDYKLPKFISSEVKDLIKSILNTDPEKRVNISEIRNHQWYKMMPEQKSPGILVGYDQIPVDSAILKQLEDYNIKSEYVRQCIEANKHNSTTTGYYLLLKQHIINGGASITDSFQTTSYNNHKNLSISISNEPQPPLFRLTFDTVFKPIYPNRCQSSHSKGKSISGTPLRERIVGSVLDNKKKASHNRAASQGTKQNTQKRIVSLSPQRENIKPDTKKIVNRSKNASIDLGGKNIRNGLNSSFKFTPRSTTSTEARSKKRKFTKESLLSK